MPTARLLHTTATNTGGHALISLLTGDVRAVLPTLTDNSVQCVVTSPPYYGLRDYGTATWEGGDAGCDHLAPLGGGFAAAGLGDRPEIAEDKVVRRRQQHRAICGKCGARRIDAQLGLEPTPDAYIAAMVEVFREVRRVMRDDAVAFVNMGDSFQDKQLQMMPARLALALQADQWILRSDIIWHKPNPMPESCRDRPTSAHEHVFLLTKRARYYYDADAVRENAEYGRSECTADTFAALGGFHTQRTVTPGSGGTRNLRNVWTIATAPFSDWGELPVRCVWHGMRPSMARSAKRL